jgi:hypothetical protein
MYDYIEHDNEFCLTCHLMSEPYERFAKSAHRDLGCKSCHKPTLVGRSKMALTQIIENPEELEEHAQVPDSKCEACHVKGDPEKWAQIASTAGHRVHLESKDSSLQGLQCVNCHSSSVHEFAATDKTCGQSGCHENVSIKLGKMSKLTLHCAACHDFTRELPQQVTSTDSLDHALAPKARECLGCHQMRELVAQQFSGEDPHNAECALCHNPHEQTTPLQAVKTCASSGCHEAVETITPMHRGVSAGALAQCTQCHAAHKFEAKTGNCQSCHQKVLTEQPQAASAGAFSHPRHRNVTCESCHNNSRQHGEVTVKTNAQCQSCHHKAPVANNCSSCHAASEFAAKPYPTTQNFAISAGQGSTKTRQANFDHRRHAGVSCAQCHRDEVTRSAANVECSACHKEHHKPTATCMACHPTPRANAHTVNVHVGCAGSGCHSKLPVPGVPRTRQFCLACHQTLVNHKPGGNCADCHKLPAPRG